MLKNPSKINHLKMTKSKKKMKKRKANLKAKKKKMDLTWPT